MVVSVTITGLAEVVAKYGQAGTRARVQSSMRVGMETAVGLAKGRLESHVKTGHLRNSLNFTQSGTDGTVGSNLPYARFVEEGTGVYGPYRRPIVPRKARRLAWFPATATGKPVTKQGRIVRRSVKGQPPVRFLGDTVNLDRGKIVAAIERKFRGSL
jgi:hypothetical protein